jgi:hypothetical protein
MQNDVSFLLGTTRSATATTAAATFWRVHLDRLGHVFAFSACLFQNIKITNCPQQNRGKTKAVLLSRHVSSCLVVVVVLVVAVVGTLTMIVNDGAFVVVVAHLGKHQQHT